MHRMSFQSFLPFQSHTFLLSFPFFSSKIIWRFSHRFLAPLPPPISWCDFHSAAVCLPACLQSARWDETAAVVAVEKETQRKKLPKKKWNSFLLCWDLFNSLPSFFLMDFPRCSSSFSFPSVSIQQNHFILFSTIQLPSSKLNERSKWCNQSSCSERGSPLLTPSLKAVVLQVALLFDWSLLLG